MRAWPILLALLAIALVGTTASPADAARAGAAQASPGSLFVLTGESGTLGRVPGRRGRFQLVLNDTGPVSSFTDRPERHADSLPLDRLVRRWRTLGFVDDPPNAALVLDGAPRARDAVIVELGRPRLARRGRRVSVPVRLVPDRRPAALRRFVARADRAVPARFGRASLFIDSGGQQSATLVVQVSNLSTATLSIGFNRSWTLIDLNGQFPGAGVPLARLESNQRGFQLQSTAPVGEFGLSLQVAGTADTVTGFAQVPAGTSVRVLAPVQAAIPNGQFSIPLG